MDELRVPSASTDVTGPWVTEADAIRLYYEELVAAGVGGYTLGACVEDYGLGLVRRFLAPACVLATVDPDSAQGRGIIALVSRLTIAGHVERLMYPP